MRYLGPTDVSAGLPNMVNGYKILLPLAKQFSTSVPLLDFTKGPKNRSGVYYRKPESDGKGGFRQIGIIEIHQTIDWVNTLLHEYAHHYQRERYGATPGHNRQFGVLLYHVVDYHYGGIQAAYSWHVEYKSLRKVPEKMRVMKLKLEFLQKQLREVEDEEC